MANQSYAPTLHYIAVAPQTAVGTPAGAPTIVLPIMRAQTSQLEWLEGRREEDYSTGDFYTEADAPINQPHSAGTIVLPARPTQLGAFFALGGFAGGAAPGQPLVPPVPMTVFQGLGADEEVFPDCFFSSPVFHCPETGNATWTIPVVGLSQMTSGAFRTDLVFPPYELPYQMYHLQPANLIASTGVTKFSDFRASLIIDTAPVFYSRGDGLPEASDILLNKLGAFLDWRKSYNSGADRAAFLDQCGKRGKIDFVFQQTCGGAAHTLGFHVPNGLYAKRTVDAKDRTPIGEAFTTRALRADAAAGASASPITVEYT